MNEEINLTGKSEKEIIDAYYNIALETKMDREKCDKYPELVDSYVNNYIEFVDDEKKEE